jgi:hypothetical protein
MSVIPNIFSGMQGKADAKFVVPSANMSVEMLSNRDPQLGRVEYEKAPNTLNSAIDYSTARGVLPCIGITHRVLRVPPVNAANAYQVQQGYGANQPRGLATQSFKNDYAVLKPFSSTNIGQPSKLG